MKIQTFKFKNIPIRLLVDNDDLWFVGKDICDALGIIEYASGIEALSDDAKAVLFNQMRGEMKSLDFVNEAGLYQLVLISGYNNAITFKRWICSYVIPNLETPEIYNIPIVSTDRHLSSFDQPLNFNLAAV